LRRLIGGLELGHSARDDDRLDVRQILSDGADRVLGILQSNLSLSEGVLRLVDAVLGVSETLVHLAQRVLDTVTPVPVEVLVIVQHLVARGAGAALRRLPLELLDEVDDLLLAGAADDRALHHAGSSWK